jgi:type IV pilus assembly protein PilA
LEDFGMKARLSAQETQCAFSLVELLVVIAVIAILAALSIPSLLNFASEANYQKDRRNAQTFASVANAAKAAGATNNLSGTNVVTLLQPPGVTSRGIAFSVSAMSEEEVAAAVAYLSNNPDPSGGVIYNP